VMVEIPMVMPAIKISSVGADGEDRRTRPSGSASFSAKLVKVTRQREENP
jgi:hypothetical protein